MTKTIQNLEQATRNGFFRPEFTFMYDLLNRIPIVRRVFDANRSVLTYGYTAVRSARSGNLATSNIFGPILAHHEKGDGSMSDLDVATEAGGLIVAGSGTTAITLTYAVWSILQQPDTRRLLEEEVSVLSPDFSDAELETLPVLNAAIDETLRLYGAAPGSLPRIVPAPGAQLAGYFIPAGTTVCTQSYSIHREASIFPDPDRYFSVVFPQHTWPCKLTLQKMQI